MNLSNEIYASYKKPVPHSEIDPCLTMMYRFFVQLCDLRVIFTAIFLFDMLFVNRPAGGTEGYDTVGKISLTTINSHTYVFKEGTTKDAISCVETLDLLTLKEFLEGTK